MFQPDRSPGIDVIPVRFQHDRNLLSLFKKKSALMIEHTVFPAGLPVLRMKEEDVHNRSGHRADIGALL